jgi:hypothetical protein
MSKVTDGYDRYIKYSDDPNLDKNSIFFIFDSLKSWDIEGGKEIPRNEIILKELKNNRFLAHP